MIYIYYRGYMFIGMNRKKWDKERYFKKGMMMFYVVDLTHHSAEFLS